MYKLAFATLLAYITKSQFTINCTPGSNCIVDGNSSVTVIAPCGVGDLIVNCDSANQCKANGVEPGLIVFSSANNTDINCIGDDACEEATLRFGSAPPSSTDNFNCRRSAVEVICTGKQSCKTISIENTGTVANGLRIVTPGDTTVNKGAFLAGLAVCGTDTSCTIDCGTDSDTCKDGKCYDTCECLGSACPEGINQRPTPEPTSPPTNATATPKPEPPTPRPTPEPTFRNTTVCDVNDCVLVPGNNFDVDCPASINVCNVDCTEEAQCQNGVIIEANSKVVNLECSSINACDKVDLINDAASEINIQITAEKAAENMNINIGNEKSNLTLTVSGKEGFSSGSLTCDGNCDVKCSGEDSCKDATYDCLTPAPECKLDCDEDNNQCPSINNLGDADCVSGSVIISGDGNSRIIATSGCDTLTVVCDASVGQCKKDATGLRIFSGAATTVLQCDNQDACESVALNVGPLTGGNLPQGFNADQFVRTEYTVTIEASADAAAKDLDLYTTGNTVTTINGNGTDALQDTTSICDGCAGLTVNCREFDGCGGASILCTDATVCECVSEYEVDIGNDTAVLATTETPRDSCPMTAAYDVRTGIANVNSNNPISKSGISFSMGALVPIILVAGIVIFGGVLLIKKHQTYKSVSGKDTKFMLKNENIHSSYQVEMHQ